MTARHRLLVALELEGDAASEVDGLRRALGGRSLSRIAPHVTVVPPINVGEVELPEVLAMLEHLAARTRPFEVEIGPPATFAPDRPVLYLAVTGDDGALEHLRHGASLGPLSPPPDRPDRPFVAHVTIGSKLAPAEIEAALLVLAHYRRPCNFGRLVLFEQRSELAERPWQAIASPLFGGSVVLGRGGRELELTAGDRLDPEEARWAAQVWSSHGREVYGPSWRSDEPFTVVARGAGRVLGMATGELRGAVCECERLIVDPVSRGEGIGTQLLRHVERLASERSCTSVRLRTVDGGPAERFYSRLGFERTTVLPAWREGWDFVVMVRRIGT